MGIPGYAGNILYVNLSSGEVWQEPVEPGLVEGLVGGWGIGQKLAYDLIPPTVDPLSPDNAIIISCGPFGGTLIPGGAKVAITTKLPLNGAFTTGTAGGRFTHMLKSAGYDHLVIAGRSPNPAYLKVADDGVELCQASDLWGRDSLETADELIARHEPCSVITMGQAGENLVKVSVAFVDKGGAIGAGGLPAIMGSKNLKAIVALQGSRPIRIAHRLRLQKTIDALHHRILGYHRRPRYVEEGAVAMTGQWHGLGKGFAWDQGVIAETHRRHRKGIACPSCPMADKERIDLMEGKYAGTRTYLTAFFGLWDAYGATDAVEAYHNSIKYEDMANRYGLDHHNVLLEGGVLGVMLRLYREGVITRGDTGGLELGDDLHGTLELLRMIAYREGFGDTLAEGAVSALRRMGLDERLASTVKGYGTIFDPRLSGLGTMEFEIVVNPKGGSGFPGYFGKAAYNAGQPLGDWLEQAKKQGVPQEAIQRIFSPDSFNVGRLTKWGQDYFSVFNLLSLCGRLYISRFYQLDTMAELYSALTGIDTEPEQLLKAGERAFNLWRVLNARAGFCRRQDRVPEQWFEPLKWEGETYHLTDYYRTTTLTREDMDRLLDDYYDERGWDKGSGNPTPEKLEELGIETLLRLPERGEP